MGFDQIKMFGSYDKLNIAKPRKDKVSATLSLKTLVCGAFNVANSLGISKKTVN